MDKKKEYIIGGVGLTAVVLALISLIIASNELAIAAATVAVVSVVLSLYFIFAEEEEIEKIEKKRKE
jgi:hypothetical protein